MTTHRRPIWEEDFSSLSPLAALVRLALHSQRLWLTLLVILGLVIGSIRSLVLERGKVKMGARMVEKERRRLLKKMRKSDESEILDPITSESSMSRSSTLKTPSDTLSERERRRQEFELMRKIQEDAQTKRRWTSLIISGST